ncbi:MAG: lysine 2,3-aminomutase, partial [Janthinobacterium sp.]
MSALITEPFPPKFKPYTRQTIQQARQWKWLPEEQRAAVQVVSHVLPFRTNEYVLDQLIDWNNIPDDPIYRLVF